MLKIHFHNLMRMIVLSTLISACSAIAGLNSTGEDTKSTKLIAYSNPQLELSTLVPEGWVEVKQGQFQRDPHRDPAFLGLAHFKDATLDEVAMNWQLPESYGRVESSSLNWDLYRAGIEWPDAGSLGFDIALCESKSGAYLIVLVTLSDESALLHDEIMLPAIQALVPGKVKENMPAEKPSPPLPNEVRLIDTRIRAADGMNMVYVTAGEFDMGNTGIQWMWNVSLIDQELDLQVYIDESPQHTVYLDSYWFDQTEVTTEMFRRFAESTGFETTAEHEGWGMPWTDGPKEDEWPHVPGTDWQHPHGPESVALDDHPVVQVSWDDASAYCDWVGGHLPTEAQWEKAARGTDGRLWPWGDTYDGNRGSFCDASCPVKRWNHDAYDDGYALTAPVGSFPGGASPNGALDMAGNVWEWVADWYDESYYTDSPYENPTGPSYGTERTQRGGAWIDNESWVRTTVRHSTLPWARFDDLGFRCALPAE